MTQTEFIGGNDLKDIYEKISRKQRGSKKYKRLLEYKKQKVNRIVNLFVKTYQNTDIVCEDLKRVNKLLNQHFTDDELEGLLELAGKSDGKITFENFTDFLNSEN